jgi:delta8-fatty-acid desaturase
LSIEPAVEYPFEYASCTTPHRTMAARADRKSKVFSRREIEAQIANGRSIVIVDSKVLKVDAWLPYHPGGDKAIRHMVGRDATDEVTRYARLYHLEKLLANLYA